MSGCGEPFGKVSELTLEKFRVAVSRIISDRLLQEDVSLLDPTVIIRREAEYAVLQLTAFVLGERLQKIDVRYPADWWQAVKERWFPKWAKTLWPIRYREEHYEVRAYYPKLQLPGADHRLEFVKLWQCEVKQP